jgi:site-specific DNA-methyltransferase (adenine-specific)
MAAVQCIIWPGMETNVIYCGDNLEVMPKYVRPESIDLIYIDPPFNWNRRYEVFWGETVERRAFEDRFGDAMAYGQVAKSPLSQIGQRARSPAIQ